MSPHLGGWRETGSMLIFNQDRDFRLYENLEFEEFGDWLSRMRVHISVERVEMQACPYTRFHQSRNFELRTDTHFRT